MKINSFFKPVPSPKKCDEHGEKQGEGHESAMSVDIESGVPTPMTDSSTCAASMDVDATSPEASALGVAAVPDDADTTTNNVEMSHDDGVITPAVAAATAEVAGVPSDDASTGAKVDADANEVTPETPVSAAKETGEARDGARERPMDTGEGDASGAATATVAVANEENGGTDAPEVDPSVVAAYSGDDWKDKLAERIDVFCRDPAAPGVPAAAERDAAFLSARRALSGTGSLAGGLLSAKAGELSEDAAADAFRGLRAAIETAVAPNTTLLGLHVLSCLGNGESVPASANGEAPPPPDTAALGAAEQFAAAAALGPVLEGLIRRDVCGVDEPVGRDKLGWGPTDATRRALVRWLPKQRTPMSKSRVGPSWKKFTDELSRARRALSDEVADVLVLHGVASARTKKSAAGKGKVTANGGRAGAAPTSARVVETPCDESAAAPANAAAAPSARELAAAEKKRRAAEREAARAAKEAEQLAEKQRKAALRAEEKAQRDRAREEERLAKEAKRIELENAREAARLAKEEEKAKRERAREEARLAREAEKAELEAEKEERRQMNLEDMRRNSKLRKLTSAAPKASPRRPAKAAKATQAMPKVSMLNFLSKASPSPVAAAREAKPAPRPSAGDAVGAVERIDEALRSGEAENEGAGDLLGTWLARNRDPVRWSSTIGPRARDGSKVKYIHLDTETHYRRPFLGRFSRRSKVIRGRKPLAKDTEQVAYDISSCDEVADAEGDGESLASSDRDADEDLDDLDDDDEDRAGFVVPEGYLSQDEAPSDCEDGDAPPRRQASAAAAAAAAAAGPNAGAASRSRLDRLKGTDDMTPRWYDPAGRVSAPPTSCYDGSAIDLTRTRVFAAAPMWRGPDCGAQRARLAHLRVRRVVPEPVPAASDDVEQGRGHASPEEGGAGTATEKGLGAAADGAEVAAAADVAAADHGAAAGARATAAIFEIPPLVEEGLDTSAAAAALAQAEAAAKAFAAKGRGKGSSPSKSTHGPMATKAATEDPGAQAAQGGPSFRCSSSAVGGVGSGGAPTMTKFSVVKTGGLGDDVAVTMKAMGKYIHEKLASRVSDLSSGFIAEVNQDAALGSLTKAAVERKIRDITDVVLVVGPDGRNMPRRRYVLNDTAFRDFAPDGATPHPRPALKPMKLKNPSAADLKRTAEDMGVDSSTEAPAAKVARTSVKPTSALLADAGRVSAAAQEGGASPAEPGQVDASAKPKPANPFAAAAMSAATSAAVPVSGPGPTDAAKAKPVEARAARTPTTAGKPSPAETAAAAGASTNDHAPGQHETTPGSPAAGSPKKKPPAAGSGGLLKMFATQKSATEDRARRAEKMASTMPAQWRDLYLDLSLRSSGNDDAAVSSICSAVGRAFPSSHKPSFDFSAIPSAVLDLLLAKLRKPDAPTKLRVRIARCIGTALLNAAEHGTEDGGAGDDDGPDSVVGPSSSSSRSFASVLEAHGAVEACVIAATHAAADGEDALAKKALRLLCALLQSGTRVGHDGLRAQLPKMIALVNGATPGVAGFAGAAIECLVRDNAPAAPRGGARAPVVFAARLGAGDATVINRLVDACSRCLRLPAGETEKGARKFAAKLASGLIRHGNADSDDALSTLCTTGSLAALITSLANASGVSSGATVDEVVVRAFAEAVTVDARGETWATAALARSAAARLAVRLGFLACAATHAAGVLAAPPAGEPVAPLSKTLSGLAVSPAVSWTRADEDVWTLCSPAESTIALARASEAMKAVASAGAARDTAMARRLSAVCLGAVAAVTSRVGESWPSHWCTPIKDALASIPSSFVNDESLAEFNIPNLRAVLDRNLARLNAERGVSGSEPVPMDCQQ